MATTEYTSPGVYITEIDKSFYEAPKDSSITLTVVGAAKSGPVNKVTAVTTVNEFESIFGEPIDSAGLTATLCLAEASTLKYVRLAGADASKRNASLKGATLTPTHTEVPSAMTWANAQTATVTEDWSIVISVPDAGSPERFHIKFMKGTTVEYDSSEESALPAGPFSMADRATFVTAMSDISTAHGLNAPVITESDVSYLDAGTYVFAKSAEVPTNVVIPGHYDSSSSVEHADAVKLTYDELGTIDTVDWTAIISDSVGSEFTLTIKRGSVVAYTAPLSLDETSEKYLDKAEISGFLVELNLQGSNSLPNQTVSFTQGSNGYPFTDYTAIAEDLEYLRDREIVTSDIIVVPGITEITCLKKLVNIADDRRDTLILLDTPQELTPQGAVDYIKDIDSSYVASYYPWVIAYNKYEGTNQTLPPSVLMATAMFREYKAYNRWVAPAGIPRLTLSELVDYSVVLTQKYRDVLYAGNINPLCNYKTLGNTAMGQKNLQRTHTALDRLNVRLLVNYIKNSVEVISASYIFSNIEETTFSSWVLEVSKFLDGVKSQGGLYDYRIAMSWDTVSTENLVNNVMPGVIQIKPTRVAEFIPIDVVILNKDDEFEG